MTGSAPGPTPARDPIAALIDDLIEREGGFVDHPADRGGPTKFGITQATLGQWRGRDVTREEVRALARHDAAAIYRRRYVVEPGFDRVEPAHLRAHLVDCGVLHGPDRAVRWLQGLLGHGVRVDGRLGPRTRAALALRLKMHGNCNQLCRRLAVRRLKFLARLVQRDPSQAAFMPGWTARATDWLSPASAADAPREQSPAPR